MRVFKKICALVMAVSVMMSLVSCSKYKCYDATHIPKVESIVDVEVIPLEEFLGATEAAEFKRMLSSSDIPMNAVVFDDLDEDELMQYVSALIDVGFSQNYEASREYGMVFINRTSKYFSAVIIAHSALDENREEAMIVYFEAQGYVPDSELKEIMNTNFAG